MAFRQDTGLLCPAGLLVRAVAIVTAPLQELSSMSLTPRTTARSRCCGLGANGVLSSRFPRKKGYSSGGEYRSLLLRSLGPRECAMKGYLEPEDGS